jgi:hypothetical protein
MIMIYGSQQDYDALSGKPGTGQADWSPAESTAMGAFMEWFGKGLAESGELVAGYWIVECESFDRATQIAAPAPVAAPSIGVDG